jgi:plasmid stabilization system protein ParE
VNPFAVERLGRSIARAFRRISTFPRSGPMVPEYPDLPIRQFFVAPYRFFYFIDEPAQTVWIVAVWHGRQLPAAPELPAK